MVKSIETSLDDLMEALIESSDQPLTTAFESQWPSPCYQHDNTRALREGENIAWKPVLQDADNTFLRLEEALQITLDPQFKKYFTRYYAFNVSALVPQGRCELLQVISNDDFDRLQENLIGHVLMKRRLRQPETLFFGLTDEESLILSVKNDTGEVILERVGKKDEEILADNLAEFLSMVTID